MISLHHLTQTKNFKKFVIISFFTLSALTWLSLHLYHHYYLSTDDAYVNANVVQIAPRVTGKVVRLYVTNNQYVKKDAPLFDIDPEPFQLAMNSAQAELALATAELENAANTQTRVLALVKKKFLSPQEGDNAVANFKTASAKVEQAKTQLAEANLNLQYTKVAAPANGWVTNVTVRVGGIVSENDALFVLISNEEFWVDANFKETEMETIKPTQTATIVADMYPHHVFNGIVESISGGAGTVFSLLPPQNATGNWVKVTQRVPVRIHILNPDPHFPLRIGTSATVTIRLNSTQPTSTS
ncbi:MAG: HlyD family secretion protein [Gammaproteobacteria bacterium]|nr:MAG: HlyD family secretion protein [Gammaproteobacteria bacterium]